MTAAQRIGITLLAAAAALLAPAVANASWTVDGRGFGHGVGLSQYGAYGYAKHGSSYEEILSHYYSRTKLGKSGGDKVRVLLDAGEGSIDFSGAGRACGKRVNPEHDYSFATDGGAVVLRDDGGDKIKACGVEGKAGSTLRIGSHGIYRGNLVAREDHGELMIINSLGVESYVKGVVPNEVPSSWPDEALKSQAVVARSYGLATSRSGPFDHYDDTRSQVYGGKSSETAATNKAVAATEGQVVTYDGEIATTYYFSTSGGQTENSEFGFAGGNPIPYLKSVKDPYDDASPVHKWTMSFSDDEMENKLSGLFSGKLKEIDVLDTGVSPRIVRAKVVGSGGSEIVTGDTLRSKLGLRSTWARFKHR
jgi:stage II sporulation protein D